MYKVLIVDDEPGALTSLKYMLDWEALGYVIVGEAWNGRQALELLAIKRIDLIITDIRMPGMSGLELIEKIREQADLPIIVMSGYEDFDYVRTCLQAGVKDYLLKPVDQDQLAGLLRKLRDEIRREYNKSQQLYQSMPMLRDHTFRRWMHGLLNDAEIREQLRLLRIELDSISELHTFVVEMDFMDQSDAFWTESELETTRFAVRNVMEEVIGPYGYVFEESMDRFGIVLDQRKLSEESNITEIAKQVRQAIDTYVNVSVTIGIGDPAACLQEAVRSFRAALHRLEMKFLFGGQIISAEQFQTEPPPASPAEQDMNRLINAVKAKDDERLVALIKELKSRIIESKASKKSVQSFIFEAFAGLFQLIKELEGPFQHIFDQQSSDFRRILEFRTLEQLIAFLENKCLDVIGYLKELKLSSSCKTAETVKAMIEANYKNNISLKMIAEEIHMNPTYLGQVFKSAVHLSFNDYLMTVRLERAKFLVLHTDKRIYEIAMEVGIRQLDTFYKKFKEFTGKSAGEFRAEAEDSGKS